MSSTSEHWLCMPLFCQMHLLGRVAFWWRLYSFLHTLSCCLWVMTILLPLFQFGWLLFLFLVWSLWPELPVLCWISGESGHPCLVPDLSGKALSFCPLSVMLDVGLSYMAFIMLRNAPFYPTLLSAFIRNGCCILSNAFSASIDMIMWFLFIFFMWCITVIDLQI